MDPTYFSVWNQKGTHQNSVNVLTFSPAGDYLASGGEDGLVIVYDVNTGDVLHRLQMQFPVISLAWDPICRRRIFCGCLKGTYILNDFKNPGSEILTGVRDAPAYAIEVSQSGKMVALAVGPEIHIATKLTSQHFATTNILPEPGSASGLVGSENEDVRVRGRSLHLIKSDTKLIVTYLNHGVICWDLRENIKLWKIRPAFRYLGFSSLSPNKKHLLVSHLEGGMAYISLETLQVIRQFRIPTVESCNVPVATAFLNDGQHLACGSADGSVNIWDVQTGAVVQALENDAPVKALASVYNGGYELIATSTTDKSPQIHVWKGKINRAATQRLKQILAVSYININDNIVWISGQIIAAILAVLMMIYFADKLRLSYRLPVKTVGRVWRWFSTYILYFYRQCNGFAEEVIEQASIELREMVLDWLENGEKELDALY